MTAQQAEIFDRGLDVFASVVERVPADRWDAPSPCAGWTARDVLGHLGSALDMGLQVMRGEQPSFPDVERPGVLVDTDPVAYWQDRAKRVRDALAGADLDAEMDTPIGRRTVADRLAFPAIDCFVHAWDIGHAAGIDVEIPNDVIAFADEVIAPIPEEMVRGPQGAFGPEVEPPADATPTEAFIAFTGRRPR